MGPATEACAMELDGSVTLWLADLKQGDENAYEKLLPLVYDELRVLATSHLRRERPGHTLRATALVHETYLRLSKQKVINAEGRKQFFGIASHTMRRILVDYARARRRKRRGGDAPHISLEEAAVALTEEQAEEVLALNDALERLGKVNERGAKVVELRYFVGLSDGDVADVLGVSVRTVQRAWTAARSWLQTEIAADLNWDLVD